ncbi:MAG TPA: FtsQ-type POTRA domain-containing protein, partial [Dehalococcoidia bacterium]|nr:FtsQ-type POTRA domain-containing protein [Dehalococcoidia bacterium]
LAEDSGLRGKSILTADLDAAEQHLESNPLIADVHIERDWPLDVRIIVTERQAWAVWQTERERYVVDKEGFVLEGIDPPIGAPVIIDAREQNGEPFTRGIADIVTTVYNLRDFMPSVVGMEPRGFRLEDDRGLVVSASDGHVAVFGDGHDFDYKLAVWKALLDAAEAGDFPSAWAEVVDLRFGDRPSLVRAIGAIEEQEPGDAVEAGVGEESPAATEVPLDEALPEEAEPAAEEPPVSDVGADATAPLPDGTTGVVEAAEPPPGLQPADPASGVE